MRALRVTQTLFIRMSNRKHSKTFSLSNATCSGESVTRARVSGFGKVQLGTIFEKSRAQKERERERVE